jgi:hypothetical protein
MSAPAGRRFLENEGRRILRERDESRERAERFNAIVEVEWVENERHFLEAIQAFGLDPEEEPAVVILPSGPRRERNVPARRFGRYRDRLTRVISLAMAREGHDDYVEVRDEEGRLVFNEGNDLDPRVQGHACSLCNGGCCPAGNDHAFVNVGTIRRYMDAHPEARPRHILEAYLARVPNRSCEGSCINHTTKGCNLPSEMRSDVCGRYLCQPLAALSRDLHRPESSGRAVAISRALDKWSTDKRQADNRIVASGLISKDGLEYHLEPQ